MRAKFKCTGFGIYNARGRMIEGPFATMHEAGEALAEIAGGRIAERGGEPIEDLELTVEPILEARS